MGSRESCKVTKTIKENKELIVEEPVRVNVSYKDPEDTDDGIYFYMLDVYLCVHWVYSYYKINNRPGIFMHTSNLKSSWLWWDFLYSF